MARVLIMGCGCRGRDLAGRLVAAGHAVRGTSRDGGRLTEIEAVGAEGMVADPDRLGTVLGALAGVSVVCWLMGSAVDAPALNGDRLATLIERLVDTPVRGLVYEGAGTVERALLADGATIVRRAADTWRIPVEVVEVDPVSRPEWGAAMTAAVGRVLAA